MGLALLLLLVFKTLFSGTGIRFCALKYKTFSFLFFSFLFFDMIGIIMEQFFDNCAALDSPGVLHTLLTQFPHTEILAPFSKCDSALRQGAARLGGS